MKVLLNVTVKSLEEKLNRQIKIDENIKVCDLFEYVVASFNGKYKVAFMPWIYDRNTKSYVGYQFDDYKDRTFKSFNLKKGEDITLFYESSEVYDFDIEVDDFLEEDSSLDFEVLSGTGYSIIDSKGACMYLSVSRHDFLPKSFQEIANKRFDVVESNKWVEDYKKYKEEMLLDKKITLNVSLEGFNKEIKRKIVVNSSINLDVFTRKIILAMNGDLSHDYGILKGKDYLSEMFFSREFCFLDLKVKDKFKVIYDWKDNWVFNVSVSKVEEGLNNYDFEILDGCGYGIIDDCGGSWELEEVFNGNNDFWGKHDINDFNLYECNKKVVDKNVYAKRI